MSHLSAGVGLYNCPPPMPALFPWLPLCVRGRELVRKVEKAREKEKDNREQTGKTQNRLRERQKENEREGQAWVWLTAGLRLVFGRLPELGWNIGRAQGESWEVKVAQSCRTLYDPIQSMEFSNSPGQNTGVGSRSLLQGIFPSQGWNPGLPHCRRSLYQLSYQGSWEKVRTVN